MLDIEVLETGSTGIFGLIRKKAKIRVSIKEEVEQEEDLHVPVPEAETKAEAEVPEEKTVEAAAVEDPSREKAEVQPVAEVVEEAREDETEDEPVEESIEETDASPESLAAVKDEVGRLVELMGYASEVEVSAKGLTVECNVSGDYENELAGPEGKTLDSMQYLVRKMVARKCSERLRITINVGNFRERRLEELKERAVQLAAKVRETGKTQVLPALNPSERREIHMVLQEDKEVRSRSVGDGLFKKILIYKPGKGNRGGRRKGGPRGGRRGKNNRNGKQSGDE
jgi:spoIIIJ-associated protein